MQSRAAAGLIYKYPIIMDACASEIGRRGDRMLAKWAEVMTGMQSKAYFLQPHIGIPLGIAIIREWFEQRVLGKPDNYVFLK